MNGARSRPLLFAGYISLPLFRLYRPGMMEMRWPGILQIRRRWEYGVEQIPEGTDDRCRRVNRMGREYLIPQRLQENFVHFHWLPSQLQCALHRYQRHMMHSRRYSHHKTVHQHPKEQRRPYNHVLSSPPIRASGAAIGYILAWTWSTGHKLYRGGLLLYWKAYRELRRKDQGILRTS